MTNPLPRIGLVALGRSTFDVAYAEAMLAAALTTLDAVHAEIVGPRAVLFDAAAEVAVGLAIVVAIFRGRRHVDVDRMNLLKH